MNLSKKTSNDLINTDVYQRHELEQIAKQKYDEAISDMRSSGNYRESEIRNIEKAQILVEAVEDVRQHAEHMSYIRHSPSRYEHVGSKVARNIKVQKSANRRTRKERQHAAESSAFKAERLESPYKWRVEDTYIKASNTSLKKKAKKHNFQPESHNVTPSFQSPSAF